jgi:hypothetical protein
MKECIETEQENKCDIKVMYIFLFRVYYFTMSSVCSLAYIQFVILLLLFALQHTTILSTFRYSSGAVKLHILALIIGIA